MKYYKTTLSLPPSPPWSLYFQTALNTDFYNTQDLAGLASDLGFLAVDYLEDVTDVVEITRAEYFKAVRGE